HNANVDKLTFHADGMLLLGLMRKGAKTAKARIYQTPTFSAGNPISENVVRLSQDVPCEVSWAYETMPKGAAFSQSGELIALYSSTNAKGKAEIWILRKCIEGWRLCAQKEIRVLSADASVKGQMHT